MRRFLASVSAVAVIFVSSCNRSEPIEYLQFDYYLGPMSQSEIDTLNSELMDRTRAFSDVSVTSMTANCRFAADFMPPGVTAILPADQIPEKPELELIVDNTSSPRKFDFDIDADEALTIDSLCGGQLAGTIQGLDLEGGPKPWDGKWKRDNRNKFIVRHQLSADIATEGLGPRVNFASSGIPKTLIYEYRITDYNESNGYLQGEFQMLAINQEDPADTRVLIVTGGEFGLINRTP